jgi:hypothetical protein
MKAHVSTLTQPTNKSRSRTILTMSAGLVVLAAAIISAVLALSQHTRTPTIRSHASAARLLIASCRVCADEALAARQPSAPNAESATQRTAVVTNARPLITYCRACADEALAARQQSAPASVRAAQPAPSILSTRPLIAQCRICRDEALAGTQASSGMVDSGAVFAQLDDPHQPGPR